ncbi:MAG: MFS transporter [Rhodovibrionaceae bacterium]
MPPRDDPPAPGLLAPESLRLLGFGFLLSFFSSFGQTFFIALFNAEFRDTFGLTHGSFGSLYSAATLVSGLSMLWFGAQIDRIDLRVYAGGACAVLATACLLLSFAEHLAVFAACLFLLRLSAQGVMSHASVTSMARYFERGRGRAIAVATMGHPAGEALFPILTVAAIAALGWRSVWLGLAALLAAVVLPAVVLLLRDQRARHDRILAREGGQRPRGSLLSQYALLFSERRFLLILPAIIAPGFINTAIFFHQVPLVEARGWSLAWFAGSISVYAAASIAGTFVSGYLVDRLRAVRLMPFYELPFAAGCFVLALGQGIATAPIYMLLAGISTGFAATITTSMWAELYGLARLGTIRSVAATLMVLSTALGPVIFGVLIDLGVSFEALFAACGCYVLAASALLFVAFGKELRGTA